LRKKSKTIKASDKKLKYVIGVDEVGRGPLAGPVAVCAFAMPANYDKKCFLGVKDSKKLSEKARDKWAKTAKSMEKQGRCVFFVCYSSHKTIDNLGISKAVKLALNRAVRKVVKKLGCRPEECSVLLDGSLKAPAKFRFQQTIIRGDSKVQIISIASVVAKVKRDKKMSKLAKKFPEYDFEIHKGYGTAKHYEKIRRYGLSPIHRKTFLKKLIPSSLS
jgi:ribonuclease HII